MDLVEVGILFAKCIVVLLALIQVVPIMAWVERRGSALMQKRLGPNRVGPLGLLQSLADGIKFIFKEDRNPGHVEHFYFWIAPLVSLIPAFAAFAVIPFGGTLEVDGRTIQMQIADLNVGLLYVFAIGSLSVYGIIMAAWASNSKYALFGGLRSSAQMISYELAMGLSVIGIIMVSSSVNLNTIVAQQAETLIQLGPISIPKWGIFVQPLGFLVFLIAVFAETNRLPFDLAEGESEIVAGYHLEYGSMKFALFMMAEYVHMTTASAMVATLFFGGYNLLPGMGLLVEPLAMAVQSIGNMVTFGLGWESALNWSQVLLEIGSFTIKVVLGLLFFVWVRWTLPRFRYDQVMHLGWKVLFPLALLNVFLTGVFIYWTGGFSAN